MAGCDASIIASAGEMIFMAYSLGAKPVPEWGMLLLRVPVRIIAKNIHEYQAFADILAGGAAGALTLANADEMPLVALVCPSGDVDDVGALPYVAMGRQDGVAVPAMLSDVFTALEMAAQKGFDGSVARMHHGWSLEPAKLVLRNPEGTVFLLTDTEARLLVQLFDAGGQELGKEMLLQRVWGYRPGLDTHTLETHIYRLRQKIETNPTNPAFLMTTDEGYRLA